MTLAELDQTDGPWRLVDGLIAKGDGWNEDVAASGLAAFHVTAADFLCGFADGVVQIARWRRRVDRHSAHMFTVESSDDAARIGADGRVGVVLGLQNAALVEDDLDRVDVLARLGVRFLQLTYNAANEVGDGCLESRDAGLSALGRQVVERCNEVGIVVDLSHVGRQSALDAVDVTRRPVVITHANRSATAPNPRNHTDEVLTAVADSGGIVGVTAHAVMNWDGHTRPTIDSFVKQVVGMVELLGEDKVAIGTDFPAVRSAGTMTEALERSVAKYPEIFRPYVDVYGNELEGRYIEGLAGIAAWRNIPSALLRAGFGEPVTRKICGENWIGFLSQQLRVAGG